MPAARPRGLWLCLGLTGLAVPLTAAAGEFLAFPGLWKTVTQLVAAPGTAPQEPAVNWHCVDEAADPWTSFAQLSLPQGEQCKQTKSERTGTTLEWVVECRGTAAIVNAGRVVFDSPSHYKGEVQLTGQFMGYPVNDKIEIEGQRYAACTSPRD